MLSEKLSGQKKKKKFRLQEICSETQAEENSNIPESEHYQCNIGIFDL